MHFNPTAITFIGYLVLMVMIGFYACITREALVTTFSAAESSAAS